MNDGVLLPLLPDVNGDALAQLRNGRFVSCEGLVWWIKAYREATLASLEDACRAAAAAIVRRGKHARWDVVILPPDGDPEGSVWGCGPTRHAALDHAVCDLRESLGEDLEPGEDFSAVAYRDAVWQDVRDKCWDAEVVGYAERVAISIKVGPSSYLLQIGRAHV